MKISKKLMLGILVCAAMLVTFQGIAYALGAASFTFSGDGVPASPGNPVNVQFNDTSSGATSWQWNFGDGSAISTVQNPLHNFAWADNFTVTLTADDSNGPASALHVVNVLLSVNGNVDYPSNLSVADLKDVCTDLGTVSVPYHKHNDQTTYNYTGTGLSLYDLIYAWAVPGASATTVTFTGSDGYSRSVPLSSIDDSTMLFFDGSTRSNGIRYINTDDYYAQNWVSKLVSITVS